MAQWLFACSELKLVSVQEGRQRNRDYKPYALPGIKDYLQNMVIEMLNSKRMSALLF